MNKKTVLEHVVMVFAHTSRISLTGLLGQQISTETGELVGHVNNNTAMMGIIFHV